MATRKELNEAVGGRYREASTGEKSVILDEFVAVTGYHRKHAIRVLGDEGKLSSAPRERRHRLYDEAVRQALIVLWEASDRVCGKRLKVLVPVLIDSMQRHGHLDLHPEVEAKLLRVSASTIDRALGQTRAHVDGQRRRRPGVGAAIRRSVPVRTFADWRDPPPGFFEMDMVEHCGGAKTDGDFVHTLVLTDIASGWTECVAMPVRNQSLVVEALSMAAADLPFAMLGVDSDNDSAFMNETVFEHCRKHRLEQTRSRAYKKNDQAWVEQKNGAGRCAPGGLWTCGRCASGAPGATVDNAMRCPPPHPSPTCPQPSTIDDQIKARKTSDNLPSVTSRREATRAAKVIVVNQTPQGSGRSTWRSRRHGKCP